MSTKNTFEKMARNTWLAGLGSIESSLELLTKTIDTAQKQSNKLYDEILTRGEDMQSKLHDTREGMQSNAAPSFGFTARHSHEEKLAKINAKVDHLTKVVDSLLKEKNAANAASTPATKDVKKARPKPVNKAKPKTKATTAKKAPAKTTAKSTSTASKPQGKAT